MTQRFILYKAAAARLTEAGVPTSIRAIQRWGDRFPALKRKVGGRGVLSADALQMILDGLPLAEVARQMRARAAAEAERRPSDGGDPGRP